MTHDDELLQEHDELSENAMHAKIAESRALYELDRLQAARSAASRVRDLAKKINVDKRTQDELDDLDRLLG